MFLKEDSDSPHQAYLAYLDRLSTTDSSAGSDWSPIKSEGREIDVVNRMGRAAAQIPRKGTLSEEEFYAKLACLDELSMREIEGRLSKANLEQMHELLALLLVEMPDGESSESEFLDIGDVQDGLGKVSFEIQALENRQHGSPESNTRRAHHRRHLWRKDRRGDRSTGD